MEKFKFMKELIKVLYEIRNAIKSKEGNEGGGNNLTWYDFLSARTNDVPLFAGYEGNIVNLKEVSVLENLPVDSNHGGYFFYEKEYDLSYFLELISYSQDAINSQNAIKIKLSLNGGEFNKKATQEIDGKTYYYYYKAIVI